MKKLLAVLCVFGLCALTTAASDKDDRNKFHANLQGINETPGPVATQATGTFDATLSDDGTTLSYTVTYNNLNSQVLVSHIHIGLPKETGGVTLFLCATPAAPAPAAAGAVPLCPDTLSGTVSGTLTAANVVGPNSQGITPGADFDKIVQFLRSGATYANVHSTRSPGGEIRGRIRNGDGDRDDRGHHGGHDHD
jgi:CHRD domain